MLNLLPCKLSVKKFVIILILSPLSFFSKCQETGRKVNIPSGKNHTSSIGIILPLGDFTSTHFLGLSTEFSFSNHRFGRLENVPSKKIGWLVSGGCDLFFGKKEIIATATYKYPIYIVPYLGGGIILNPGKRTSFSLIAGPALSVYSKTTRLNFRSTFQYNYSISKFINAGIRLTITKESISEPLWSSSVFVGYVF